MAKITRLSANDRSGAVNPWLTLEIQPALSAIFWALDRALCCGDGASYHWQYVITTVLFDLDGTLYNRDLLVRSLAERQYRAFVSELQHVGQSRYVDRLLELDDHGYQPKSDIYLTLVREFGFKARFFGGLGGRYVLWKIRREEKRLAGGWTYEPPTFYERNEACTDNSAAALCQYVMPSRVEVAPTEARVRERRPEPAAV